MLTTYKTAKKSMVVLTAIVALSFASGCSTAKKVTRLDSGEVIVQTRTADPRGVSRTISFLPSQTVTKSAIKKINHIKRTSKELWEYMSIENLTNSKKAVVEVEAAIVEAFGKKRIDIKLDSTSESNFKNVSNQGALGQDEARFRVTGFVTQYAEKSDDFGLEPVVSVVLNVIDVRTGEEIYTTVGTREGWTAATLTSTAKKLAAELANNIVRHSSSFTSESDDVQIKKAAQLTAMK